jgi:hypothetical protein
MRFEVSITADSMVVFRSETLVRLSQEQAGVMPGKSGFGEGSAARATTNVLATKATMRAGVTERRCVVGWAFMAGPVVNRMPTFWQRVNAEAELRPASVRICASFTIRLWFGLIGADETPPHFFRAPRSRRDV